MENAENNKKFNHKTITPEEIYRKVEISQNLFRTAYQRNVEQLRLQYPELTQRELNHRAYDLIEKEINES